MSPVPGLAEKAPMGVAGTGAHRFIELLEPFGMNLEYVSQVPGEAAARKLLRSILAKGMAGVLIDCLWATESMGLQDWAFEEIQREFDSSSSATSKRYLSGTAQHLKRRQIEMMDVPVDDGRRGCAHVLAHSARQEDSVQQAGLVVQLPLQLVEHDGL